MGEKTPFPWQLEPRSSLVSAKKRESGMKLQEIAASFH